MRRLTGVFVVAVLLASACGGGSGPGSALSAADQAVVDEMTLVFRSIVEDSSEGWFIFGDTGWSFLLEPDPACFAADLVRTFGAERLAVVRSARTQDQLRQAFGVMPDDDQNRVADVAWRCVDPQSVPWDEDFWTCVYGQVQGDTDRVRGLFRAEVNDSYDENDIKGPIFDACSS